MIMRFIGQWDMYFRFAKHGSNFKGELYPCEEMYDSHQLLIGDVDKGIDANTILKTTVEYINKANTLCKDCWAYRFCPHCFTSAFVDGHYSMNRKISECKRTKKHRE